LPPPVYLPQDPEDADLVARSLGGDSQAFELLVERHQKVLFNVALRMLGDREDARDATQNTFLKVYQKLETFDPAHRFFSWVYKIMLNECLNVLRARRPFAESAEAEPSTFEGPFEAFEAEERRQRVQAALLALPREYREVVVLRHFGGLAYDEIAATVGLPVKTVKSRLYTARHRLGQLLLGWGSLQ
jgi:RNA polymerase sigma-70 factor (ECF subfamily)